MPDQLVCRLPRPSVITALVAHNDDIYLATRKQVFVVGAGDEAVLLAGNRAEFNNICAMAPWPAGGVVVADRLNGRVSLVGRDGIVSTLTSGFFLLRDICMRPDGCVVVNDTYWLWVLAPDRTARKLAENPTHLTDFVMSGIAACADNSVIVSSCDMAGLLRITTAGTRTTVEYKPPHDFGLPAQGIITDTAGMAVVWRFSYRAFADQAFERLNLATGDVTAIILDPGFELILKASRTTIALDWFGNLLYVGTDYAGDQYIMRADVGMQPGVGAGSQPAWTPTTHKLFPARARACAEAVLAFSGSHVLGALWLHVLGQIPAGALGAPI
jgi:hypothetical protein